MPVTQGDLSLKKAEVNNDEAGNGGRLTATDLTAIVFPDVSGQEKADGLIRYRKVFLKNTAGTVTDGRKYADTTLSLLSTKVFMENISPAGDRFLMKRGTATDVQSDIVDSGWAGTGYLEADAAALDITLQIRCEAAGVAGEIFQCASADILERTVLISSQVNGVGYREFVVLNRSTDPTPGVTWGTGPDTNLATLTFSATPLQYAHKRSAVNTGGNGEVTADIVSSYTIGKSTESMTINALANKRVRIKSASAGAGQIRRIVSNTVTTLTIETPWSTLPTGTVIYEVLDTYGCMCVGVGDIGCSNSAAVATHGGGRTGQYNTIGYLKLFPIGTVDDTWTLTFSSSTLFTIASTAHTVPGTFDKTQVCRPSNGADFFFELNVAGWDGGTWGTGDTLVFSTVSSSKSVWLKEIVVAGIASHAANSIDIGANGDTV